MTDNAPASQSAAWDERRRDYPWRPWGTVLLVLCIAFLWRLRASGRIWGTPWDILPNEHAMGSGGLLINWLAGAFSICVGSYTFYLARSSRAARHHLVLAAFAFIGLGILPFLGLHSVFSPHFAKDVADRSKPVIVALERYRVDHAEYPPELGDLVPEYVESVPSMGYGSRRELHYYRADTPPPTKDAKPDHLWETWVGSSPYALVVERVPGGTMIFRPTGEYEDLPRGRRVSGTAWGGTSID